MGRLNKIQANMGCAPCMEEEMGKQYKRIETARDKGNEHFSSYISVVNERLNPLLTSDDVSIEILTKASRIIEESLALLHAAEDRFHKMKEKSSDHYRRKYKKYNSDKETYREYHTQAISAIKHCQDQRQHLLELKKQAALEIANLKLINSFEANVQLFDTSYQTLCSTLICDDSLKGTFDHTYRVALDSLEKMSHLPRYEDDHKYLVMTRDLGLFRLDDPTNNLTFLRTADLSDSFHHKASILAERYKGLNLKDKSYELAQLWVAKKDLKIPVLDMANLGHHYLDLEFKPSRPKFLYSDYLESWLDINPECYIDETMHGPYKESTVSQSRFFELLLGSVYIKQEQFDDHSLASFEKCLRLEPDNLSWKECIAHKYVKDFYEQYAIIMSSTEETENKPDIKTTYEHAATFLAATHNKDFLKAIDKNYQLAMFKMDSVDSNLAALSKETDSKIWFSKNLILAKKLLDSKRFDEGLDLLQDCVKRREFSASVPDVISFATVGIQLHSGSKTTPLRTISTYLEDWLEANDLTCCQSSLVSFQKEIDVLQDQLNKILDIDLHAEFEKTIQDKLVHFDELKAVQKALVDSYFFENRSDDKALNLYDEWMKLDDSQEIRIASASMYIHARNFKKAEFLLENVPFDKAIDYLGQIGRIKVENIQACIMFARMILLSNKVAQIGASTLNLGVGTFRLNKDTQIKIAAIFSNKIVPVIDFASRPAMVNLALRSLTLMTKVELPKSVPYFGAIQGSGTSILSERNPLVAYDKLHYNAYQSRALALSVFSEISRTFGPQAITYLKSKWGVENKKIVVTFPKIIGSKQISIDYSTTDALTEAVPNVLQQTSLAFVAADSLEKLWTYEKAGGVDYWSRTRIGADIGLVVARLITEGLFLSKKYNKNPRFLAIRDLINQQTMIERLVSLTVRGYFSVLKPAAIGIPIINHGVSLIESTMPNLFRTCSGIEKLIMPVASTISVIDAIINIGNFFLNFKDRCDLFHINLAHEHYIENHKKTNYQDLIFERPTGLLEVIYDWDETPPIHAIRSFSLSSLVKGNVIKEYSDQDFYNAYNKKDLLASYKDALTFIKKLDSDTLDEKKLEEFIVNAGFIIYTINGNSTFQYVSSYLHEHAVYAIVKLLHIEALETFFKRFTYAEAYVGRILVYLSKQVLRTSEETIDKKILFANFLHENAKFAAHSRYIKAIIAYLEQKKITFDTSSAEQFVIKLCGLLDTLPKEDLFNDFKKDVIFNIFEIFYHQKQFAECKKCYEILKKDEKSKKLVEMRVFHYLYDEHDIEPSTIDTKIKQLDEDLFANESSLLKDLRSLFAALKQENTSIEDLVKKIDRFLSLRKKIVQFFEKNDFPIKETKFFKASEELTIKLVNSLIYTIELKNSSELWEETSELFVSPTFEKICTLSNVVKEYKDYVTSSLQIIQKKFNLDNIEWAVENYRRLEAFLEKEKVKKKMTPMFCLKYIQFKIIIRIAEFYQSHKENLKAIEFYELPFKMELEMNQEMRLLIRKKLSQLKAA